MNQPRIEWLEARQLFQVTPAVANPQLTTADVTAILGQAASQAMSTQAIVVEDRDGNVLGEYDGSELVKSGLSEETNEIRLDAALRARTASFFESQGEAFTTRTARFIIQDHFPTQVFNTAGGPLYGVEFSSTAASDVIPVTPFNGSPIDVLDPTTGKLLITELGPAGLSGDPGGIPLYMQELNAKGQRQAVPVGSIGVAGDMSDTAARSDLALPSTFQYAHAADPNGTVFNGKENADYDESVALAGAGGYMAPSRIRSNNVFVSGLRLPFVVSPVAHRNPKQTLATLLSAGSGAMPFDIRSSTPLPGTPATLGGNSGTLVRRNTRADPAQTNQNYGIVSSNDAGPQILTSADVTTIISEAVTQAMKTRAGIRNPIGSHAVVFVSVVDRDGDLLGSFRMADATNFSYDVSIQKARTAAFFSDDTHAFSARAIGFISQRYFAPGINDALTGPLFHVQNGLVPANLNNSGEIVDDTLKPIGTVAAAMSDPTTGAISVSSAFSVGQIITFGTDTSHEYLITAATANSISVKVDGIDPGVPPISPLTAGESILPKNPLKNGITIFPGGVPLYKNGQLIGAIGVSGDGVDQDDTIAYAGTNGYRPTNSKIESDALAAADVASYIGGKLQTLENTFNLGSAFTQGTSFDSSTISAAEQRLEQGLSHERLPYVKYPRNPNV